MNDSLNPFVASIRAIKIHTNTAGCSIRVETLGNFEGKSRLPRQNLGSLEKYRGNIEYIEAEFKYPRKITEAEF